MAFLSRLEALDVELQCTERLLHPGLMTRDPGLDLRNTAPL
jgi:hypothetical protein